MMYYQILLKKIFKTTRKPLVFHPYFNNFCYSAKMWSIYYIEKHFKFNWIPFYFVTIKMWTKWIHQRCLRKNFRIMKFKRKIMKSCFSSTNIIIHVRPFLFEFLIYICTSLVAVLFFYQIKNNDDLTRIAALNMRIYCGQANEAFHFVSIYFSVFTLDSE